MMAGIIVQLVGMGVICALLGLTIWRASRGGISKDLRGSRSLVSVTNVSTMCILTRNLYRAVELAQGWKGYLITHEVYFDVLDGSLMVLATVVFNLVHPARRGKEKTVLAGGQQKATSTTKP
jgi:hypothetical protein